MTIRLTFVYALLINFGCLSYGQNNQVPDTVILYMLSQQQPRLPVRGGVSNIDLLTNTSVGYVDSIRCDYQILDFYNQYYYLEVKDVDSVTRLRGLFFDKYPCDKLVSYNKNGDTLSYTEYQLYKYDKPVVLSKYKKRKNTERLYWAETYFSEIKGIGITYDLKRKTEIRVSYSENLNLKNTVIIDYRGNIVLDKNEKVKDKRKPYKKV